MGLFDFLKPKKKKGLASVADNAKLTNSELRIALATVEKDVRNLVAVGREQEARKRIHWYLEKCSQEFFDDFENPDHLRFFATAATSLGVLELGTNLLEITIEGNLKHPILDLTTVYTDLGRMYHHTDPKKELRAYHLATQCKCPPKCKFPSSIADKANAHNLAYMCARRLMNAEYSEYHDKMRRKLVPDLDWDDTMAVVRWVQTRI